MNTTSASIVANKISREVTALCYGEYANASFDSNQVVEILATLESAMQNILTEADCLTIAVTCGSMWVGTSPAANIVSHAISNVYCNN